MMKRLMALVLLAAVWIPFGATAQDISINAFNGVWRGSALSESNISVHFRVTARDLDVEIRPFGAGGFTVRWATILRQKGDPNAPVEILKEAQVAFNPDKTREKVWVAATQGDPVAGEAFYWARLGGQTLTIYSLGIAEDGTSELQIYRRSLTGLGMQLDFSRTVDGEAVRSARGKLIKFAN
jgi:hypothetical protein